MVKFKKFFIYFILILVAVSMLYPFLAMINLSLVPNSQIFNQGDKLIFSPITADNYLSVYKKIPLWTYFANSLFVALVTTLGQVLISAMAGYAFARINFRGRNLIFFLVLVTMLVPPQVNIVPLFFLMRQLHWINTYQALIIPGLFGGFGIFLMRQYYLALPKDLEEAAKIDGCNIFTTFVKIGLPLALPAIVTLAIFTFVSSWNSFMWPLLVTNTQGMRTLPVGLAIFKGSFRELTMWGDLLACSVVCCIPVVGVFLLGKKYLLNDIMQGGVKE